MRTRTVVMLLALPIGIAAGAAVAPLSFGAAAPLHQAGASSTADAETTLRLAKVQESRGALAEAERTLLKLVEKEPPNVAALRALAGIYVRAGHFERAIQSLERAAGLEPSNAATLHLMATHYFEKSRDPRLRPSQIRTYLEQGVAAEDRALAADPHYFEALVYKSLLLRELATRETNAAHRQTLLTEADALRARAVNARGESSTPALATGFSLASPPPPPPPPPVPGAGDIQWVYAQTSFTATGNSQTLEKVKDVRPVYPPMAIEFGVQGTVVIEAAVDRRGHVVDARVVESVPMLNQSVIDAVKQWQFDPATATPAGDRILLTVRAAFIPPR